MKDGINVIIHDELKRLWGEVIQVSIIGLNFNPTGLLTAYDEETGRVFLERPKSHIGTPLKSVCFDATHIVAVAHYTGYPHQNQE